MKIRLSLPGVDSLKAKRRVIKSLKDRLRQRFNVAVAEMGYQDVWQSASIAVATVSPDGAYANRTVSLVAEYVGRDSRLVMVDYEIEVF